MAAEKSIAVIGSINMDLTARADRHPRVGETVMGTDLQYIPGGKGANQAVAAARLGGRVSMFGCVGGDAFGERLTEGLRENGVDVSHIRRIPGESSGIALITVAGGDNSIVVIPGANRHVTPGYLAEQREAILESDIVLLQNEIPEESVEFAVDMCSRAGKTVIWNPAPMRPLSPQAMEQITYCTPNEHEAALLFPGSGPLPKLAEEHGGKVIITLGERGAIAWDGGALLQIPPRPAQVVDTTGAGDTFNGALAYALARGWTLKKALLLANDAASLSTERYGAQSGMPSCRELPDRWQ